MVRRICGSSQSEPRFSRTNCVGVADDLTENLCCVRVARLARQLESADLAWPRTVTSAPSDGAAASTSLRSS